MKLGLQQSQSDYKVGIDRYFEKFDKYFENSKNIFKKDVQDNNIRFF